MTYSSLIDLPEFPIEIVAALMTSIKATQESVLEDLSMLCANHLLHQKLDDLWVLTNEGYRIILVGHTLSLKRVSYVVVVSQKLFDLSGITSLHSL
jgi:hypothetical protein